MHPVFKVGACFCSVTTFTRPGVIFVYNFCLNNEYTLCNNVCNEKLSNRSLELITMEVKILANIATQIFKIINELKPNFMKNIFTPNINAPVRSNAILLKKHN